MQGLTQQQGRGQQQNMHKEADYACVQHSNNNSYLWLTIITNSAAAAEEQIKGHDQHFSGQQQHEELTE